MSKPKFTPGPWEISGYLRKGRYSDVCARKCGLPGDDSGPAHIACVGNEDERMPHLANARLIAKAPEMYAFLQKVAARDPHSESAGELNQDEATALLAEIDGESS